MPDALPSAAVSKNRTPLTNKPTIKLTKQRSKMLLAVEYRTHSGYASGRFLNEAKRMDIDVKKVAMLSRIRLTNDEATELGSQLENIIGYVEQLAEVDTCLLYTSPRPRDSGEVRMPSSARKTKTKVLKKLTN